ncbi:MAG: AMP-binding protein, partial [Phycisphaerae bacterium]
LTAIWQEQIAARPDAPAIIDRCRGRDRVLTFAQLQQQAQQLARLLHDDFGLNPGDPVLVLVPMAPELYIILLALFQLGLVALFLDPSAGRAHIERCCGMVAPKAFIAVGRGHLLRLVCPALRRIPHHLTTGPWLPATTPWQHIATRTPWNDRYPATPQSPALITFTSGSTGLPKAAVRSHGFLLAQHQALAQAIHLEAGQVDLATLPIFTLANLASGVTTVIPDADLRRPGHVDPQRILAQCRRHYITRTVASPAFLEVLADACETDQSALPTLTEIYTGGAPVLPRLLERLHAMAPHAKVQAVYGSTEAEPIAHLALAEITADDQASMNAGRGLLAGTPVASIALRILRPQWGTPVPTLSTAAFETFCQPPEWPGEIVVAGAHVLAGYLGGVGDEQTKFCVDGQVWHRTGDMGYLDHAGRLWLLGRCAACIHDARGALYPLAVETAVLQRHPTVLRAALLALNGQRVLVMQVRSAAPADLPAQVQRQLAEACLDTVRIVPLIPVDKRHNAKIDYPALRHLLGS